MHYLHQVIITTCLALSRRLLGQALTVSPVTAISLTLLPHTGDRSLAFLPPCQVTGLHTLYPQHIPGTAAITGSLYVLLRF